MTLGPTTTLPSGDELPQLGFGTYNVEESEAEAVLTTAYETGYRHFDGAEAYQNEDAIGPVLDRYDRDELFLTSKVLPKHLHYNSLIEACQRTLDRLRTDYLDLYLIHWPNPAISLRESLDAMATLHEEGLVRNIGVSNFSAYQLSCAQHISDVPIAVNQLEFHPWYQQRSTVEYCHETDVVVEAAAPLARTDVFEDPVLTEIAADHDISVAQLVLRWAIERDVVVIPKSSTPKNIRANTDLFEWEIGGDELARIDDLDRGHAVYTPTDKDWNREIYGIPP